LTRNTASARSPLAKCNALHAGRKNPILRRWTVAEPRSAQSAEASKQIHGWLLNASQEKQDDENDQDDADHADAAVTVAVAVAAEAAAESAEQENDEDDDEDESERHDLSLRLERREKLDGRREPQG
jgi:hypothetical protein